MTVWFDAEDLFHFVQSGHRRPTGIQRLTVEVYRALHELDQAGDRVGFVRHGSGADFFQPVTWAEIEAVTAPTAPAAPTPPGAVRRATRRLASRLPEDMRAASMMQAQSFAELTRLGLALVRPSPRRTPYHAPGPAFGDVAQPGDALFVLGAPWFRLEYPAIARWLRDVRRMRFGLLVHDLVPIRRPEWSPSGLDRRFDQWHAALLPLCDVVLADSQYTASDVEAYARERGIKLPGRVRPIPVGTGFPAEASRGGPARPGLPPPGGYVLFVSTMEPRKNHALLVQVWRMLLAETRAGRRRPETVPDLVFAGGQGWSVADLLLQLENTDWLGGRVRLVRHPNDTELRGLYEGCLFTIFPSLGEGWGLPVTESLAFGKPCLCSNAASLPEAGGDLCRYFDPENLDAAYQAVCSVLDDRPGLAAWEAHVREAFRPVPWSATAAGLLGSLPAGEGELN